MVQLAGWTDGDFGASVRRLVAMFKKYRLTVWIDFTRLRLSRK